MNNFLVEENQTNSKKNISKINLSIEKDNSKENSKKPNPQSPIPMFILI